MHLIKSSVIAATTVLVVGLAGGCSSDSSSDSSRDRGDTSSTGGESKAPVGIASFCTDYTALDPVGDYKGFQSGVTDLAEAGAPKDMPGQARAGFTLYAEIVAIAFSKETADALAIDVTEEEADQIAAFKEFVSTDC